MDATSRNITQLVAGDKVRIKGANRIVKAVVVLSRTTNVYFTDGTQWFAVNNTELALLP